MINTIFKRLNLFFITFILSIYLMFFTTFGLTFFLKLTQKLWPHFTYEQIKGSIFSEIKIKNLSVNFKNFDFNSQNIEVKINPFSLLLNEIDIEHFKITNSYLFLKKSDEPSKFHWSMPVKIKIHLGEINNFTINYHDRKEKIDTFNFLGLLDQQGFYFNNFHLINNKNQVDGRLSIGFNPKLNWNVFIYSSNFNPQFLSPHFPGLINFSIESRGKLLDHNPDIEIKIYHIEGKLKGLNIHSEGYISLKNHQWLIPNFNFQWEKAIIKINGYIEKKWNLNWLFSIPSLSDFFEQYSGSFQSKGTLLGDWNTPYLQANIKANNLKIADFYLENLILNGNIQSNLNKQSNIGVEFKNLMWKNLLFNQGKINTQGLLSQHQINIFYQTKNTTVSANLEGNYHLENWQGTMKKMTVKFVHDLWQLKKPMTIKISPSNIEYPYLCLFHQNESFCHSLNYQKNQGWVLEWVLKNLSIHELLQKWLDQQNDSKHFVDIKGLINSSGKIEENSKKSKNGKFDLTLSPGSAFFIFNNEEQDQSFQGGKITGVLNQTGFNFLGAFIFNKGHILQFNVTLPKFNDPQISFKRQTIKGNLSLNLNNLSFFSLLIHHLQNPKGLLALTTKLTGTIEHPQLIGRAELHDASTNIPSLNLNLKQIVIDATGQENGKIFYKGSLASGDHRLFLQGVSSLFTHGFPTSIKLWGDNLLLINTHHYQIYGNPNVTLHYLNHAMSIDGNLSIPKAKIISDAVRAETEEASSDIVFIDHQQEKNIRPNLDFTSRLNIMLGNDILFNVRGATGKLKGHLFLNFDPQTVTTGLGELFITDGQYTFYGTDLNITRGRLIYSGGPIDDPGIDIQATRKVTTSNFFGNTGLSGGIMSGMFAPPGQVTVGLNLIGSYKDYQVVLFSEPAVYDQTDILSLLIFGSVTDNLPGSNANRTVLLQAASSLNFGGNQLGNITQQIQNTFGLDQLGVEQQSFFTPGKQSPQQNTAFVVGKKLGSRLFLSYSIGVMDPISIVRIRFDLTRGFYIQTENSSIANGADIYYSFEK